jgi:hypothetical protein
MLHVFFHISGSPQKRPRWRLAHLLKSPQRWPPRRRKSDWPVLSSSAPLTVNPIAGLSRTVWEPGLLFSTQTLGPYCL